MITELTPNAAVLAIHVATAVPVLLPLRAMGKSLCSVLVLSLLEVPGLVPGVLAATAAVANGYREFSIPLRCLYEIPQTAPCGSRYTPAWAFVAA